LAKLSVHGLRLQRAQSDGLRFGCANASLLPARKNPCKIEAPDAASRAARLQAFFLAFTAENKGRATFRARILRLAKAESFFVFFQFTAKTKPYAQIECGAHTPYEISARSTTITPHRTVQKAGLWFLSACSRRFSRVSRSPCDAHSGCFEKKFRSCNVLSARKYAGPQDFLFLFLFVFFSAFC